MSGRRRGPGSGPFAAASSLGAGVFDLSSSSNKSSISSRRGAGRGRGGASAGAAIKCILMGVFVFLAVVMVNLNSQIWSGNDNVREDSLDDNERRPGSKVGDHYTPHDGDAAVHQRKIPPPPPDSWQSYQIDCRSIKGTSEDEFVLTENLLPKTPRFKMSIHDVTKDRLVSASIKAEGCHECGNVRRVQEALKKFPDAYLVDVGANIGMYSLAAAAMGHEAFAIEPHPESYRRICLSANGNKGMGLREKVHVLPIAATLQRGRYGLSIPSHHMAGAKIEDVHVHGDGTPTVEGVPIDELGLPPNRPIVLKLDAEGHEPEALAGAKTLVCQPNYPITFVSMRVRAKMLQRHMEKAREVFSCLADKKRLVPYGFVKDRTQKVEMDPRKRKPDQPKKERLDPHNLNEWLPQSGFYMDVVWEPEGDGGAEATEGGKRRTSEEAAPQPGENDPKLYGRDGTMYVRQRFLNQLEKLEPFPRTLHVLFPDAEYYKKEPGVRIPFVKHTMLRFIEKNPAWDIVVHDDDDMDGIIKRAASDGIISREERDLLVGSDTTPAAHPVERADLARLLYMWYYGGLYVDADALRNARDFEKVFGPTVKMCLPIYLDVNFAQSIACSSPKNNLFIHIIKEMTNYRMTSNDGKPIERRGGWARKEALFDMGPPMYNRIVFRRVFGEEPKYKRNGEIEGMEERMKLLQEVASEWIATGKYIDDCNSFIAQPYKGCQERNRHELYKAYNMTGWGSAVKKRWESDTA